MMVTCVGIIQQKTAEELGGRMKLAEDIRLLDGVLQWEQVDFVLGDARKLAVCDVLKVFDKFSRN
jgi:hypothetical protein